MSLLTQEQQPFIYYLIDRNRPLYSFQSRNIEDIFNELFNKIDFILQFLLDSGITQLDIRSLNFNNYECFYAVPLRGNENMVIKSVYKFDFENLYFTGGPQHYNVEKLYPSASSYLIHQIREKIALITSGKKSATAVYTQKQHVNTKTQQQSSPVKRVLEATKNKIDENKKNDVLKQRLVPTVRSSEAKLTAKKTCQNETVVSPDVPRPMESVLLKDTLNDLDNLDSISDIDPNELKKTIDALENIKRQELEKIKELEEISHQDAQNFSKYCNELGDTKREIVRNKEREKERRNRFEANKGAYRKMKQHIFEGKLNEDNISPLFKNEYPIYKFMDEKGIIDAPDDYITYLNLYDELYPSKEEKEETEKKEDYVPHNIHYLSEEEQLKYKNVKNSNKDMISEFMNETKNTCNKKYPSLDEILKKIDDETNDDFADITFDIPPNNNGQNISVLDNEADTKNESINDKLNTIAKVLSQTINI